MGLIVINPGASATVQDQGRTGYREWGISRGGAFDLGSAALANALLGNESDCAVIELTLFGGTYEARIPLAVALAGAPMAAIVARGDGTARPVIVPQSVALAPGDRLVLGGTTAGARTYLAVKGGWQTRVMLESRSREERLRPGDVLDAEPGCIAVRRPSESWWEPPDRAPIRIIDGPDAALALELETWTGARFRVGRQADRMGLRLEGPDLPVASPPGRASTPVAPGAVQIAGGQAIVLGVACGTMGGYPHVAHVIGADLDRVGQLRTGDTITFQRVSLAEARALDRARRRLLADRLRVLVAMARDDCATEPGD